MLKKHIIVKNIINVIHLTSNKYNIMKQFKKDFWKSFNFL